MAIRGTIIHWDISTCSSCAVQRVGVHGDSNAPVARYSRMLQHHSDLTQSTSARGQGSVCGLLQTPEKQCFSILGKCRGQCRRICPSADASASVVTEKVSRTRFLPFLTLGPAMHLPAQQPGVIDDLLSKLGLTSSRKAVSATPVTPVRD